MSEARAGFELGRVRQVARRPAATAAPDIGHAVTALAGLGLAGDRHADPLSPRQLLLAGADTYALHGLAAGTLRENLLLETDLAGLPSGSLLRVGATAVLRLMFPCEPCARLDMARPGLVRAIGQRRGVLARVVIGGQIMPGDRVSLLAARLPAWPADWRARIALVLAAMPPQHVIGYGQLAHVGGIPAAYCRAFPRAIAALGPGQSARALGQRSRSDQPRWMGAALFADEETAFAAAGL